MTRAPANIQVVLNRFIVRPTFHASLRRLHQTTTPLPTIKNGTTTTVSKKTTRTSPGVIINRPAEDIFGRIEIVVSSFTNHAIEFKKRFPFPEKLKDLLLAKSESPITTRRTFLPSAAT